MVAYRLHEVLVAAARPTAEVWRLGVAILLIVAGFLVLNVAYFQTLASLPVWSELRVELRDGNTARAIWAMLGNFIPLLLVTLLVAWALNRRGLRQLIGPVRLVLFDFWRVARLAVALYVVMFLIPAPGAEPMVGHMAFASWVRLVPLSLALIFLQISAEEILFRGYLQSQIAARFASPLVWMLIPSVLFGALHYEPSTYGENAIWLAVWSGLFGLAAADLTARAGNLGPAMALHFVNNVAAMLFSSMQGNWDGLALYVYPFGPEDVEALAALMPIEGMAILCGWLVARIAIRR
ncbi:MAG: CPBP family intramembrane metalloprotease [Rhodobacteraceae bacterium]|nr:CPBP family intramembrane metalloprotease [Paracoccaceae bacterium]